MILVFLSLDLFFLYAYEIQIGACAILCNGFIFYFLFFI